MSDFITNGASVLPPVKIDVRMPQGGVGEWAADDANELRQAALDLRSQAISEQAARVAADAAETAARLAADAVIVASGATPSNVNLAPVTPTGSVTTETLADLIGGFGTPTTVLYASPSGDDGNDGRTWATAKKTILGAWDALPSIGGTIYIADLTYVGGEVAGQGLWFVGGNDPSWESAPAGWRVQKAVRFIGVGGSVGIQFGAPAITNICPGQPGGSTSWDYDKPGIHLAGTFSPMVFSNLCVSNHPGTAVVIGLTMGYRAVRAIAMSATQWFYGCNFAGTPGSGADTGVCGPTVDIGYAFWIYFFDSVIHATYLAPIDSDRRAAVLITDSGLQYFYGGRWAAGGIIAYKPGLVVNDLLVESSGPELPPVVWMKATQTSSGEAYADIRNANRADATAGVYADIKIEGGSTGYTDEATYKYQPMLPGSVSSIFVSGICTVQGGPCQISGGARVLQDWDVGTSQRYPRHPQNWQEGHYHGRSFGRVNNAGRGNGPVAVRWPNLAEYWRWWTGEGITVTYVTGMDGKPSSAYHFSASGNGQTRQATISRTLAVGDKIIFATWIRHPNGDGHAGGDINGTLILALGGANNKINSSGYAGANPGLNNDPGDGNWTRVVVAGLVTDVGTPAGSITAGIKMYDKDYPIEVFAPMLVHIPAAECSDNEFGDVVDTLEWSDSTVTAGQRGMGGDLAITNGGVLVATNTAIDAQGYSVMRTETAANIANKAHAINVTGKAAGRTVFDTTNNRLMIATGATDVSTWKSADGGTTVTPA